MKQKQLAKAIIAKAIMKHVKTHGSTRRRDKIIRMRETLYMVDENKQYIDKELTDFEKKTKTLMGK